MESNKKYTTHVIRTFTNKKSQYMPSISSISDISVDGKNAKWSHRWNIGVQSGAENPHDDDEFEYTSNSFDVESEDFSEKNIDDEESSISGSLNEELESEGEKEPTESELEVYKKNIKDYYRKIYEKKYKKFEDFLKSTENKEKTEDCDRVTKAALTGLGFWPTYYKTLKKAHEQNKLKEVLFEDPLSKLISEACYKVDTKGLCSCCKYNHIKDCEDICLKSKTPNTLDIIVKKSKSGKVIDAFKVNLDPKALDKKLLNSINISIKSKRCGRMETYDLTNETVEEEIEGPSYSRAYSIEPTFVSTKPKTPTRVELNLTDHANGCVIKTKTQTQHNSNYSRSVNASKSVPPKSGVSFTKFKEPSRFSRFDKVSRTDGDGQENSDVTITFTDINKIAKDFEERVTVDYGCDSGHHQIDFSQTIDYQDGGFFDFSTDEVRDLVEGDLRLHAFKINNKGVDVPLFLNIGKRDTVYSGQGFVSGNTVGLFKISVVEPVEPKFQFGRKMMEFVGMNKTTSPHCKCGNLNTTISVKSTNLSNKDIFNNILDNLAEYTGIPWVSPDKTTKQADKFSHMDQTCTKIQSSDVNVCSFHKKLINKTVDRSKFGRDIFCQLKYMNSITFDVPISLVKDTYTRGSNLSSYFNGFHEQLLSVHDTRNLDKYDLYNNHKFTFILRKIKGPKNSRNFTIVNTTSGQHLCIDLLTHELRFDDESKFSKYFVPAIFKVIALPTLVEAISKDVLSPPKSHHLTTTIETSDGTHTRVERLPRSHTNMSTTDQYIIVDPPIRVTTKKGPDSYNVRTVISRAV